MALSPGALVEIDVSDRPLKLFISYAHDSREHDARVLELANRLRTDGFDCDLDQFQRSPPEGSWHRQQILIDYRSRYLRHDFSCTGRSRYDGI
jgi:hypothetical protein